MSTLNPQQLKKLERLAKVLDDGKFKAVPKDRYDMPVGDMASDGSADVFATQAMKDADIAQNSEQFDISGKVDTKNPIYRFYEKDMQKYLTKNYGAKQVTDAQGVTWVEMKVDPKKAKLPVEAFGLLLLGGTASSQQ